MCFNKILIIQKMHGIGDVLFTLPACKVIKDTFADAQIDFLIQKCNAFLLKGFPEMNRVIHYKYDNLQEKIELIKGLRKNQYQLIIDFSSSRQTANICYLSGAKLRWGFIKKKRYLLHYFLYNRLSKNLNLHRINLYLSILEQGGLSDFKVENFFKLPEEILKRAKGVFHELSLDPDKPTIFIQPFTADQKKDWPIHKQLKLAKYFKDAGVQVLFGGASYESERLAIVRSDYPVAAGKGDLLTIGGLMKLSSIVVGGDTGPIHLADALGKRVVMWMGPTSTIIYGPYNHPEWVVRPKNGSNINDIEIEQMILATNKALLEQQA